MCYGQSDVPLADSFESELAEVRRKLALLPTAERFISSPLARCLQLATVLAGAAVETDESLMEMSFGDWELERWDDIDRASLDLWADDYVRRSPPGGESLAAVYDRVRVWLSRLQGEFPERVAAVTHAGVIRCLHVFASGIPLADAVDLDVDYGEVFRLDLPRGNGPASITRV